MILVVFIGIPISLNPKTINSKEENPGPFFDVGIIVPNTPTINNQWLFLFADLMPKIGIEVSQLNSTSWAHIYPRSWDYPGPYPIPTHAQGGFDIIKIGYPGELEYNPNGLYDSFGIVPNGNNIYQYNSSLMDTIIEEYTTAYDYEIKENWAHDMQALFYEDLPSLTAYYSASLYIYDSDFTGWDGLLWEKNYESMENWTITGQTEFRYATPASFLEFFIYGNSLDWDLLWLNQIYNRLFQRDPETKLWLPNIAFDYNTTDGFNWTIYLNPSAKWADGSSLTSEDVLFSYQTLLNVSDTYQSYRDDYYYITNDSCSIINGQTIKFSFNNTAIFPEEIMNFYLIPKHKWDGIDDFESTAYDWAMNSPSNIIGAGPYTLNNFSGEEYGYIHLTRNDFYDDWTGITPYFDDIYFEFYSSKETALSALSADEIHMIHGMYFVLPNEVPAPHNYEIVPDGGIHEITLNNYNPYFGTGELCPISGAESAKHVRKAMNHIIPREQIIDEIYRGVGFSGVTPFPITAFGFDDSIEPYEYNLNLALEHMLAAGFDVTLSPTRSRILGINFNLILGFIVLIGGIIIFIRKQWKQKH
jgi:ABC-type transport system substrate-binding protein